MALARSSQPASGSALTIVAEPWGWFAQYLPGARRAPTPFFITQRARDSVRAPYRSKRGAIDPGVSVDPDWNVTCSSGPCRSAFALRGGLDGARHLSCGVHRGLADEYLVWLYVREHPPSEG